MSGGVPWAAWWAAPGPLAFLDEVLAPLRQGRSVVIGLPTAPPPGLAAALEAEVAQDSLWRWTPVTPTVGSSPLASIVAALWGGASGPDSLGALVAAERLQNRVLWIDPPPPDCWPVWRDWLPAFARATTTQPAADRPVVCAAIVGIPRAAWPRQDPTLGLVQWRGRLDGLDLELWAAALLRGIELPPFTGRLRRELIATLGGADPSLAVSLRDLTIAELCAPQACLRAFAAARGWQHAPPHTWEAGVLEQLAGEDTVHLAALSLNPATSASAIAERIWRAEVRVLFPLMETLRRRLIERHRVQLRVPVQVEGRAPIEYTEDLELGHLHWQLRGRLGPHRAELLAALHHARNALAHLEPLPTGGLVALLRLLDTTDLWRATGGDLRPTQHRLMVETVVSAEADSACATATRR